MDQEQGDRNWPALTAAMDSFETAYGPKVESLGYRLRAEVIDGKVIRAEIFAIEPSSAIPPDCVKLQLQAELPKAYDFDGKKIPVVVEYAGPGVSAPLRELSDRCTP